MPILFENDRKRNPYKNTLYQGQGFQKTPKAFYESDTDDDDGLNGVQRSNYGGFIDLGSIISNVGKLVNDNKETIQSVASTAGKVVDLGKAINETIKASNENNRKMEQVKNLRNSKKGKKTLTPEQDAVLIGDGFATFKRN
jgi:hypothetical protein